VAEAKHLTLIEGGESVTRSVTTDYAGAYTNECGEFYGSLGLDDQFLAIFQRQLGDLHFFVGGDSTSTNLGVQCSTDIQEDTHDSSWIRVLRFSRGEYRYCSDWLSGNLKRVGIDIEPQTVKKMTLELLFYEATADLVANAVYMQQQFDKYIPDFNGQSPFYQTEFTIARKFLGELSLHEPTKEELILEYYNFRSGAALAQLERSMIRENIAANIMNARALKKALGDNYTDREKSEKRKHQKFGFKIEPMTVGELRDRVTFMQPRISARQRLAELVLGYDMEEL